MLNITEPQLNGCEARDFLPENHFTDVGICYQCNGKLKTNVDEVGFKENPKSELTITCIDCGYEPTE